MLAGNISRGSSTTARTSSSLIILNSPPSIFILDPAYRVIIIQSSTLQYGPFGNFSLSLYASGPTFKTLQILVVSCAPVFESGMVWAPLDEKFAQDVVEECAAFPNGQYDDYVDSMTQAVLRYRQGGFITTYTDDWDESSIKFEKEYKYY